MSGRFQVITPDLRGFGRSIAPSEEASIGLYASDMLGLLDVLGIQQAVIGGHSMGGMVTIEMYRRAPERFRGMLLNATTAAPAPTIEQFTWRGYAQQSREQGAESLLPILLPQLLTGETRRSRPELTVEVANLIRQASLNGLVGGANALAERPDNRSVLPTISVPTLILFGLEDPLYSFEVAQMLHAAIPNSELAIIPEASHAAILEKSKRANQIIRRWATRTLR